MNAKDKRKLIVTLTLLILLITIGVVGYVDLLNVRFIDALYMTIITISTVGYSEIAKMTDGAKLFSIFIIFGGISIVGYAFTNIVSFLMEGSLQEVWRLKKMNDKICKLKDHYIICGGGETGQSIISEFKKSGHLFVVIEKDEDKYNDLIKEDILAIHGDATHETILQKCRIDYAKGLISSLSTDVDNVYTVLTARQMNPNLYIVSRAIENGSREKLKKAGADNTVSPNEIGGRRMAALVMNPSVMSFLDLITRAGDVVLDLESITLCEKSYMNGRKLEELRIPDETGLIVLGIKKKNEENIRLNPTSQEILEVGDNIIVLGENNRIMKLKAMACDK